jgi:proteic killer suppression protein
MTYGAMLDVRRIKSKALKLFAKGDASRVNPSWRAATRRILTALNAAAHRSELNMPGLDFHELKGDRKGTFAVKVTGNWRVTFKWDDAGPFAVDLEDYHGK